MKLTPLQRRAERKGRNQTMVDMNLVSLIDVFTILIFFLLSSASGVELLASPKAVTLPESMAHKSPVENLVVVVSREDILVDGRKVASVAEALAGTGDVIASLQSALQLHAQRRSIRPEDDTSPGRAITIMGDKDIPYQLLRKVMVTAARASYSDVSFAVRRKDV